MEPGFCVTSDRRHRAGSIADIELRYQSDRALAPGASLWLFMDFRQGAGLFQVDDPAGANHLTVTASDGSDIGVSVFDGRTLDLHPRMPEFWRAAECRLGPKGLADGESITLRIAGWRVPPRPIHSFGFWLLVDDRAAWAFRASGFRTYRHFEMGGGDRRIDPALVAKNLLATSLEIAGDYPPVPASRTQPTEGIFWGELHGMAFNQRPFDDFYEYARDVARLDFACACLFSYSICLDDVWGRMKAAARRHTHPGEFVAYAGFECGTPPDDSHRCAYFAEPDRVPPIFCESRPPVQDPMYRGRLHPDTVVCETREEFYAAVERFGGFVGGHFHTLTYDREAMAEIYQKQPAYDFRTGGPVDEERRVFELLNAGKRFAVVGGSDTHDSMPGNPDPEPGMPTLPAGAIALPGDELSARAIREAILARRVYATTGARIVLGFGAGDAPMGSVLPASRPRRFDVLVDGTSALAAVELIRSGEVVERLEPTGSTVERRLEDAAPVGDIPGWYLLKVTQADGERAWSSPIWFERRGGG